MDDVWARLAVASVIGVAFALVVWRAAWVVLVVLGGAVLGAAAFIPRGQTIRDGPSGCEACGTWISVLSGAEIEAAYYPWYLAAGVILGAMIGFGAWGLVRAIRARSRLARERRREAPGTSAAG